MDIYHLMALSNAPTWYEWYTFAIPSQHPSEWRFIVYGSFRGSVEYGIPNEVTFTGGWAVFDWNYGSEKYVLTKFTEDPNPLLWSGVFGRVAYTWVDDNTIRIVGGSYDDGATPDRHAGKLVISSTGGVTFSEPLSYACDYDSVSDAVFYQGWALGYDGGVVYTYADGIPNTNNCWIGKLTSTNAAVNLGPLRIDVPDYSEFAPLCPLGATAAGNGFAVVVKNCVGDTTVQSSLVNIASSTPAITANLSFAGTPNKYSPLHLGARKVLITDVSTGLTTLLHTDSDTAPTTLTKGDSIPMPTLPFRSDDVASSYSVTGLMSANNCWVNDGIAVTMGVYHLTSNLADGETYRNYYCPVIINSIGESSLEAFVITADSKGNDLPVDIWWESELQTVPAFCFVGAPGGKASLLWRSSGDLDTTQTVLQLNELVPLDSELVPLDSELVPI